MYALATTGWPAFMCVTPSLLTEDLVLHGTLPSLASTSGTLPLAIFGTG